MASSTNDSAASVVPSSRFAPREESRRGLALTIERLNIPDLRIVAGQGEQAIYDRDQSDVPRLIRDNLINHAPEAVVQPSTSEAVSRIVVFGALNNHPLVPRGAASSPFGGAVPANGGIVIDMSTMDRVLGIDLKRHEVQVQAGARWADIEHELGKQNIRLISSPSSKFSTVGGWIAGGGIGVGSLGGGPLKDSIPALTLVTPDGHIRRMRPGDLGFDAVFGSEGQIGVVTEATLKVKPIDKEARPHLVTFTTADEAVAFARSIRQLKSLPEDMIYFSPGKLTYSNRLLGQERFPSEHALLVTSSGKDSEAALNRLIASTGSKEQAEYLARLLSQDRFFPMKLRRLGPGMLGAEVIAPFEALPQILERARELSSGLGLDPLLEVHFLAGPEALLLCYYLTDQSNENGYMLDAVKSMIITAALVQLGARPYSLGVWNNAFADRLPTKETARLRKAKNDFDPLAAMNAGKYFAPSDRLLGVPGRLFSPAFAGTGLKTLALFSRPLSPFLRFASSITKKGGDGSRDPLLTAADQCAMCGACVGVCPAYRLLRDERVTARGKLLTARALAEGKEISPEHAHRTFLCMRCKACEQVCQAKLELLPLYDQLETQLEARHGRDKAEIERFIRYAEVSPEYEALVERGLVLGAPKNGMGGERRV
jgi:FAD/FMN-containing dehydrogenase/ferredoxin